MSNTQQGGNLSIKKLKYFWVHEQDFKLQTHYALTKVTGRTGGKLVSDRVVGNTLDGVIMTTDK